jgi:hypothetical protein
VVAGIRDLGRRLDPIAFITFPGVPVPNSHFVAAGVVAATAVLGAALAWVLYSRRVAVPAALQPVRYGMGEGLFIERAYRLGGVTVVLPLSRVAGWVEAHVVDGALGLISDSVALAGQPRQWLAQVRARQLVIGLFVGVVALGAITIVLAGRLFGKTG